MIKNYGKIYALQNQKFRVTKLKFLRYKISVAHPKGHALIKKMYKLEINFIFNRNVECRRQCLVDEYQYPDNPGLFDRYCV